MNFSESDKILLLGASRGLGAAVEKELQKKNIQIKNYSRKTDSPFDFSKEDHWESYLETIVKESPTRIFYFAGGGPFGSYDQKQWKDHLWSFRVVFLFPAFLIANAKRCSQLRQLIFVGSSVAEYRPDPFAASYSAGKSALRALFESIQSEGGISGLDLRLISPGYMDTVLLPSNAWPRRQGHVIASPQEIAEKFMVWAEAKDDTNRHLVLPR